MEASFLSDFDLYLWSEGTHYRAHEKLGAHLVRDAAGKTVGTRFAVWAPNADAVSIIGSWNDWEEGVDPMTRRGLSGVFEGFVPGIEAGALYKYAIRAQGGAYKVDKADPFGFASQIRPKTASRVWEIDGYEWGDHEFLARRGVVNAGSSPMSIYEVHLGSWRRVPEEKDRWLTYREMAPMLAGYLSDMGYTHAEFLPVSEHPFDGSWGYQTVGYFAPTSRFGTPQDFMFLIDTLHRAGIGVILDWVPAHFPKDEHGLVYFDGSHLFENADPRLGEHAHWGTAIFDFGKKQVRNFLISNALYWIDRFHVDALRVDAVASMLYLDYGRDAGNWVPNKFGGRENLEAIDFLKTVNDQVHLEHPDVLMIAEESTAWPMVSRKTYLGGLGFDLKWNMGFMHDTLRYFSKDPVHRRHHHNDLTFSMMYHYSENFTLPFSHDEVVHLKKSMLGKMPGDDWRKFANLRAMYGFLFGHPGKKLLFMGGEFGQWHEWDHDGSLDWHLLDVPLNGGLHRFVRDLLHLYRSAPEMTELDESPKGFEWIDCDDNVSSVISFLRLGKSENDALAFVFNFTPVVQKDYRIGLPWGGDWVEAMNSDARIYGGSGQGNAGGVVATRLPWHGRSHSAALVIPPLGMLVLRGHTEPAPEIPALAETLGQTDLLAAEPAPPPGAKKPGASETAEPNTPAPPLPTPSPLVGGLPGGEGGAGGGEGAILP